MTDEVTDKLAQAIWLAYMKPEYRKFAQWSANETKQVWHEKAVELRVQMSIVGLSVRRLEQ